MAFSNSPKIPTDGLVLALDPADTNSYRLLRSVEVMVVGGGGGGGMDMGGGGGGGGVLYDPNAAVTPGTEVTVTVGAGGYGAPAGGGYRTDGAGPQPGGHQFTVSATNGSDSAFGTLIAKGGGFGASSYYGYSPNQGYGGTGASGGGCSGYTHGGERYVDSNNIVGQGYPGGNSGNPASGGDDHYSGGGGGAGGRGTSGPNHVAPSGLRGHGGPGVIIPRMSPYYYGGGGGGSGYSNGGGNGGLGGGGGGADCSGVGIGVGDTNGRNSGGNGGSGCYQPGGNGGANTGGGGGGGSHYNSNNKGGEGGSGIVIVRYNGPQAASGGTYSFSNGVSYHTFTSSGTFTPYSSDTTWYDSSGNGYHFTLSSSSVRQVSGNKVYMDFKNGIAKYLPGGTLTNIPAYSNATVCIFSNIMAANGDWKTLLRAHTVGPNTGDDHQVIISAGDGISLGMYDNNGTGFNDTGFDMNSISNYTTDFHFYVWKFSNTSPYYQFYYDNNLDTPVATQTSGNATFTQGIASIGAYHNSSNSPTSYGQVWGHMGPFLYYSRHLNASELRQIYNTFKSRYQ